MMYLCYGILDVILVAASMFLGWMIAVGGLISDDAWKVLDCSSNTEFCKRAWRMFRQHVKTIVIRMKRDFMETHKKDKA